MIAFPPQGDAVVRRGITLLEVLISIGILAVGLGSIVALIPAGRSQAERAVILDRAAILAANVLADAATTGLLRPQSAVNGGTRPLVIDPAAGTSFATLGGLGTLGIYSRTSPATQMPAACQNLFFQLRDDVVIAPPPGPDDLPTNSFVDGARSFEGRMSALLCLQANLSGGLERMSAVVFHRRDPVLQVLTGTLTSGMLTIDPSQAAALGSRLVTDVIKPGVVAFTSSPNPQFHQVTAGRLQTIVPVTASATGVYAAWLTFSTGPMITASTTPVILQFLPDSVGLAERPFVRETSGAYTQ